MDGLLGSRATWLAALGAGLSALQQAAAMASAIHAARVSDDFHPGLFVISALNTLATVGWCGYFSALYRAQNGLQTITTFRSVTNFTLGAVFGIRTFLLGVQIISSMFLDLPGMLTIAIPALSIALWICVLVMLAFARLRRHAEQIVTPLIAITVLQSLGTVGPLLRWPLTAKSSIAFAYAATQILFLIALRNDSEAMIPPRR